METNNILFMALMFYGFALIIYIVLCACGNCLARRLGRESFGWTLFCVLFTPILGIFLLHCLGKTSKKEKIDFYQKELWKQDIINGTFKLEE